MSTSLFHQINDLNTEIEVPDSGSVHRIVYQDEHLKAILFGFAPGHGLAEHKASMPAIMHFISGDAKITLGDVDSDAAGGTWVHMVPNLPHSIAAQSATVMLLLLLKSGKTAGSATVDGPR